MSSEAASVSAGRMVEAASRVLVRLGDRFMLKILAAIGVATVGIGLAFHNGLLASVLVTVLLAVPFLTYNLLSSSLNATRLASLFCGFGLVVAQNHLCSGAEAFRFGPFVWLALVLMYREWRFVALTFGLLTVHELGFAVHSSPHEAWIAVLFLASQAAYEIRFARQTREQITAAVEIQLLVSALGTDDEIQLNVGHLAFGSTAAQRLQKALLRSHNALLHARRAVDSITLASSEIAMGNQNLSVRTERTATNLQATASSMEQLARSVSHTAQSASEANKLAATASQTAVHGHQVVAGVVAKMEAINASSRKVVDIIGVIDNIAFQTNILALNAAVESARAGEQGRGFSVVAAEVRSLAKRAANAAKEIKALIGASVDEVSSGATLVGEAGCAMEQIVVAVRKVSQTFADIATAAAEQDRNVEHVNCAVAHLDRLTQQNAALVEQSSAAAESLKEQARGLAGVVSVFKLEAAADVAVEGADASTLLTHMSTPARSAKHGVA